MKNKNDPAFVVDAGKLLAQLHLGGCAINKDSWFFNSGIVNMQDGATPEDPKGVMFDTQNADGIYELAYMPLVKSQPIKINIGRSYQDFVTELEEAISAEISASGIGSDEKKQEEIREKVTKEKLKQVNQEIDEAIQKIEKGASLDNAFENIVAYFKNFAGEANAKSIQKSDVVVCYLEDGEDGPASVKSYKNYKIPIEDPASYDEMAKQRFEDWKNGKEVELRGLGYKVGYTLEVNTTS